MFSEILAMLQELPFPGKQKENPYVFEFDNHEKLKCAYSHIYFEQNYSSTYATSGPGSSVGKRLTTGWMVRDRIPVGTRFSACPERPWSPHRLL